MRKLLIALVLLPLAACGVAQTAVDSTRQEGADEDPSGATTVSIPVPLNVEEPTAPGGLDDEQRFRKDFGDGGRFVTVTVEATGDTYVLDRTNGCVYLQDAQRGRDPVLSQSGRPDCTYAQR